MHLSPANKILPPHGVLFHTSQWKIIFKCSFSFPTHWFRTILTFIRIETWSDRLGIYTKRKKIQHYTPSPFPKFLMLFSSPLMILMRYHQLQPFSDNPPLWNKKWNSARTTLVLRVSPGLLSLEKTIAQECTLHAPYRWTPSPPLLAFKMWPWHKGACLSDGLSLVTRNTGNICLTGGERQAHGKNRVPEMPIF